MAEAISIVENSTQSMGSDSGNKSDDRISRILGLITKFVQSDLSAHEKISEKGDELDAIIAGLNTLGEELNEKLSNLKFSEQRINLLLDVLLKTTIMDFSQKADVSEKGDEIDALAAGLNTLSEELDFYITSLNESRERFRLLVEEVKDYAIFMIDPNGNILSWNKGAERIKGYKTDEIIGKNISVFYTEEEIKRGEPEYNLKTAKKTGRYETEGLRVRKNGTVFLANVVLTALYDNEKNLRGYAKVTRDITELRKSEEEIKQKTEELARSNAELEKFAYVASHDLQEPLRTITSYLQLLKNRYEDKLDKDANDFINFASDGSSRMRNLIRSILEYSRINRIKPFEAVDCNKLVEEVLKNIELVIKETGTIVQSDKLPVVMGDQVLLSELFQNIISNAIKFKNGQPPEIKISCVKKEGYYLFSIKDNGIGIEEKYGEKIFEIFQRLHSIDKYPGTGMGLAICKKIVERHGGKIWMESELGKGTTFYFTIKSNFKR
jgi:PAS domain S-box-containing protein